MTILHTKKQPLSLVGLVFESNCCIDCGFNTAMSISNMKIGTAQLRTLVRGLLAAGATRNEVLDVVMSAASGVRNLEEWLDKKRRQITEEAAR